MTEYVGTELDLFQGATNWKRYWSSRIRPYLGPRVLEVGAGLGANAPFLITPAQLKWHFLEPDLQLHAQIEAKRAAGLLPAGCTTQAGSIDDVPSERQFDTILYIDVMEHIKADVVEFAKAAERLANGGHLVVLSPAHQALFSPFDATIGHHRRYSRTTLRAVGAGASLRPIRTFYLDSVGLFASLANRLLLKSTMPSPSQIRFWDGIMVPLSRILDPLLLYAVGKTVVGIWRKP